MSPLVQFLFITLVQFHLVHKCYGDEVGLITHLLGGYNNRKYVRPSSSSSQPLTIKVGLALNQIIELEEQKQVLVSHLWVRQYWNDPYFTWTPSDYGGVTEIQVPADLIWTPDLALYNNADDFTSPTFEGVVVKIIHTGDVLYLYPILHKTICGLDIFHFPFDQQNCYMRFGSWGYDYNKLDLQLKDVNAADFSTFLYNSEWGLVNFTAERLVESFDCCPDAPFVSVAFNITIRRRWIMYFFYLLMPNLLINITAIVQFLLPSDSGEKITLSITIYLSMVVYLLIMQEILPNSENIPMIVGYIVSTMVVVSFAQIVNIVVLQLHYNGNHDNYGRVPHWTRKIFLHGLAKILCMHRFIVPDELHNAKFSVHISNLSLIPEDESKAVDDESIESSEHEIKCESPKSSNIHAPETAASGNITSLSIMQVGQTKTNEIYPATENKSSEHEIKCESPQSSNIFVPETAASENMTSLSIMHVAQATKTNKIYPATEIKSSKHEMKCGSSKSGHSHVPERGASKKMASLSIMQVGQASKIFPATETKVPLQPQKLNSTLYTRPRSSHERRNSINIIGDPKRSVHLLHKDDLGQNRDMLLFKILKIAEEYKEKKVAVEAEDELRCEWQQLAMVIDRFMFFVYLLVTIILWLILFVSIPSYKEDIIL